MPPFPEAPEVDGYFDEFALARAPGGGNQAFVDCAEADWAAYDGADVAAQNLMDFLCPGERPEPEVPKPVRVKKAATTQVERVVEETEQEANSDSRVTNAWDMLEVLDGEPYQEDELDQMGAAERAEAEKHNERYLQAFERGRDLQRLRAMDEGSFWDAYRGWCLRWVGRSSKPVPRTLARQHQPAWSCSIRTPRSS